MTTRNPDLPPGELFVVATPIGNLADLSARAREVLCAASIIACEDSRVSRTLLTHYDIRTRLTSYHAHNEAQATESLLCALEAGEQVALICDAGTPLLSDPGARLVAAARAANIRVTPVPGPNAAIAALSCSGLPAQPFYFGGFLPTKSGARQRALEAALQLPATLVFYEAPHRLCATLEALEARIPQRRCAVARELTKRHEECRVALPGELLAHYQQTGVRGECVLLIAPPDAPAAWDDDAIDAALREALTRLNINAAAAEVAALCGVSKRALYTRALALKS